MDDIIQLFAIGISRTQRKTKLSNMTLSYNVPSTSTWCHLGGSYKLSLECVCNFLLTEGRVFFIYIFLLLPTYKNSSIPLHVWWYAWESRGGYPTYMYMRWQRDTENWMVRVGGWVGEDSNYRRKKGINRFPTV